MKKISAPSTDFVDWLRRIGLTAHIVVPALLVPICVAGAFPPPADMNAVDALLFLAWLSFVGGLAGYGLWSIP